MGESIPSLRRNRSSHNPSNALAAPSDSTATENTHPFRYQLADGEHGYIARNGIARKYTHGRYASDSRNAILAWQTGQADLTDGSQGHFAKIDQQGHIEWLTTPITVDGDDSPINVSNLNWTMDGEQREAAYLAGWEDGYDQALTETEWGITPDWMPHR